MTSGDDGDGKPKAPLGAAVPSIVSAQIGEGFHLDFLSGEGASDKRNTDAEPVRATHAPPSSLPQPQQVPDSEPPVSRGRPDLSSGPSSPAPADSKPGKREARRDKQLGKVLDTLEGLDRRLARIERVQRETTQVLDRLRRAVKEVDGTMARRQDIKKLKKKLDQLEVVELADDFSMPGLVPGSDD